ncbi:MAG TPA: M23 family metallopeptidase [Terriglobales bacterium]|nr:M23 family metallopeptidase [Terriglobales bacterium]
MPGRSHTKAFILVVLLLVLAVVGTVSYLGWRQSVPGPSVASAPPRLLGHKTAVPITIEAARGSVAGVEVKVVQGGKQAVVVKQDGTLGRRAELPATLEISNLGLREGAATIEVRARDDFWRPLTLPEKIIASWPVTIDLSPPKIEVLASTGYYSPGGVSLVAFRVDGAAKADVKVGDRAFPSFPMGDAARGVRVALLALPYDYNGATLAISAVDEAGNAATRGIPGELKPRKFPSDRIEIKDSFLSAKMPELLPQHPPGAPAVEAFLIVNREHRKQAEQAKRELASKTSDKPLWEGPFVQPRNTKVFANFAETRTYVYQGREIDTQVHYGFDLASTKQSPVPAANKGTVVFAGPLSIYGNTVIVDHGLSVQTLYGHLSSLDVKVGDVVETGTALGRSGTTGLAIGDHIHYEVLVNGVSVTPVEWWDAKWMRDRLNKPLREAGLPEIAGLERAGGAASDDDDKPARAASRRRRAR